VSTLEDLLALLHQRAGFEAVNQTVDVTRVQVLGRVLDKGENARNWRAIKLAMLRASRASSTWKLDLSRSHFLLDDDERWAWRLIFSGEGIESQLPAVIESVIVALTPPPVPKPPAQELTEMPLPGVTADRNNPQGGRRGAGTIGGTFGNVPLGPAAIQSRRMGG
jgi:hypothetical protein